MARSGARAPGRRLSSPPLLGAIVRARRARPPRRGSLPPLRGRLREPPAPESSDLLEVPFPSALPPPLPSSSHSQSRRHLGSPSITARGATQAAAAGAARWPHHLKRQERGQERRCGGGLGRRREAGAESPRWRERKERRRRIAGRDAGDGPGLPRAPCTHRRASAGRRVRPSRAVFVITPLGDSEGAWSLRLQPAGSLPAVRWAPRHRSRAAALPCASPSSRRCPCPAAAAPLRPGAAPRRARPREGLLRAAFGARGPQALLLWEEMEKLTGEATDTKTVLAAQVPDKYRRSLT
ncbi:uncharacterized protein LOC131421176 [Diceros bicornis minor]|uniref:uncharacterized protein LOC131421176 n=1 Tax=Diceros bicornis minor TaxID=77932 RepID=UPI0026F00B4B|nr:uncharacterized protein LOC131421176 [Diceros bicornis minor]